MNESLPMVTVLIAARPGQADIQAVTAARQLDYPPDKLEIIVARGKQPSVQRNAGMRAARGGIIYFLDDDSVPDKQNLHRAADLFKNPEVLMVGGPSPCPADAPFLEQIFGLVHGSLLAFGPSFGRYKATGRLRPTSEKELILCNLAARKDVVRDLDGFDEKLYPNEENALMDQLQKRGKLMYHPEFVAYRRPRSNLRSFFKMVLNYGRGRAEQVWLHPTSRSLLNFVPPMFCLYLLSLPFLWVLAHWASLIPLGLYVVALLAQAAVLAAQGGVVQGLCTIPVIFLVHVGYGLGVFWGLIRILWCLLTRRKVLPDHPKTQVVLETVPR